MSEAVAPGGEHPEVLPPGPWSERDGVVHDATGRPIAIAVAQAAGVAPAPAGLLARLLREAGALLDAAEALEVASDLDAGIDGLREVVARIRGTAAGRG